MTCLIVMKYLCPLEVSVTMPPPTPLSVSENEIKKEAGLGG